MLCVVGMYGTQTDRGLRATEIHLVTIQNIHLM